VVDLAALTWVLPGYRIQTDIMAELLGAPNNRLLMFVPPAGWAAAVVEPAPTLAFGLAQAGWQPDEARETSLRVEKTRLASLSARLHPVMIDEYPRVRQMVSVAAVADALAGFGERERLIGRALLRCADHVGAACLFDMDGSWIRPRRLRDYLNGPPPDAWTEVWFSLGGQLATDALEEQARQAGRSAWDMYSGTNWERENPITEAWLREIMPIAADVATAIGSPVLDRPGDVVGNGYDYHVTCIAGSCWTSSAGSCRARRLSRTLSR
jgi:hypothetical protein